MSDKIACTACGAMILATTAAANGGQCVPCKRGFRKNIEEGKVLRAERKAALANPEPATLHWRWLVNQAYRTASGISGLSVENQNYFAAFLLEGEVYNGGFHQYFGNSSADFYPYALRGLKEIGVLECRDIVIAAKEVLFGESDVPATQPARWVLIEKMGPRRQKELTALDRRFNSEKGPMRELGRDYARRYGLWDGFGERA